MRKIVLDTNVIVSAGIKKNSIPYQLVENWVLKSDVDVMACPSVLREYRVVLSRPKFARFGFPPSWFDRLIFLSTHLPEPPSWPHPLPDSTDAPFLALAHSANATLITGNLKHFPKSARNGVKVLSPDEYLAFLLHED
jgi:uncharacterized protein